MSNLPGNLRRNDWRTRTHVLGFNSVDSMYVHSWPEERSMSFDYERWKESQFSRMEQEITSTTAFPPSILWAGIIWVAIGVLTLLTVGVLSAQTGTIRSPGSVLAGLFFLYGGFRTTSGATPGTLKSGIASILLGFVWVGSGVLSTNLGVGSNGVLLVVSGGMGGALILAGFLAVIGRSCYQRWRDAHAGGVPRSHRK